MNKSYDERLLRAFIESRCGSFSKTDVYDINDYLGKKYNRYTSKKNEIMDEFMLKKIFIKGGKTIRGEAVKSDYYYSAQDVSIDRIKQYDSGMQDVAKQIFEEIKKEIYSVGITLTPKTGLPLNQTGIREEELEKIKKNFLGGRKYDEKLLRDFIIWRCGSTIKGDIIDIKGFLDKKYNGKVRPSLTFIQDSTLYWMCLNCDARFQTKRETKKHNCLKPTQERKKK